MVAAIHNGIPTTLYYIDTNLLKPGMHPPACKKAKFILISTLGKKEKYQAKSYRPISFLSCVGKTLDKIMAGTIASYAERIGTINDTQGGSRAGISVQDE